MDERIYTERKIVTGVALGGPIAGGYYFWRTFNAIGKPKQAIWSFVIAIAVLAISFGSRYIPLLDLLPNKAFWFVQIGLTYGVTRGYLAGATSAHLAAGKAVFGWGNTLLVGVISVVITIGSFFGLFYLSPETFDPSTAKYFGRLRHEVIYVPSEVSEFDVGRVANALTETGFFDEEMQKSVVLTQPGSRLIITIPCTDEARSAEAIEFHRQWRQELQRSFPDKHIVIDMVGPTDERIARLE